jgi:hypothetical protein
VPDAALPPDAARNRDVDQRRRAGTHFPVRRGRGVAQRRVGAGAQDRREGSSLRPQGAVAEGIDATTHDDERSRPDAVVDGHAPIIARRMSRVGDERADCVTTG